MQVIFKKKDHQNENELYNNMNLLQLLKTPTQFLKIRRFIDHDHDIDYLTTER